MPLTPGTRIGAYEVVSQLGAGGMGEVYKARDTRLDRFVAIKALPDLLAADAERVARFEREAKVLAALNHPHIAGIYGVEEAGPARYLILEFVDGQSLADRLSGSPGHRLTWAEAMAIARQILDALEAAHDKGIVHRDLKPANVMLDADGRAKVLDFGLARIVEADGPAADAANSPTMTAMPTQMRMILGTAAYMAPEQAKGRTADKRSDIWAFGCVFYEMLTARQPFEAATASDTLAGILEREPDWQRLPPAASRLEPLLRRCLEKDVKRRLRSIGDVAFWLDSSVATTAPAPTTQSAAGSPHGRALGTVAALLVGLVAGGVGIAVTMRGRSPAATTASSRFALPSTPSEPFTVGTNGPNVAISPDGQLVVYTASRNGRALLMAQIGRAHV